MIVSGFVIALGGPDWWHTDPVGHFFNSLHLWSVEAFMAFMVIHLWGKFWMAAWRGRRRLTWITGVVAFVASIVECFTGYLSQQNFDSQWISTSGKDAFNAVGVGAFFNLMNFGQMLLWHIVLIPMVLVALVGAHVLAVRVRGVVHPLPARRARGRAARRAAAAADAGRLAGPDPALRHREGSHRRHRRRPRPGRRPGRPAVVSRRPPVTVATWAKIAPADFVATAASELAGTSETATYGPPYNNATGSTQTHPVLSRRPSSGSANRSTRRRPSCSPRCPSSPRPIRPWPPPSTATTAPPPPPGSSWDTAYAEGGDQGHLPQRHRRSCPRPPTGRSRR